MRTIRRALSVFGCFSNERPSLSLQEISITLRLAKSTTFRLVQSLEDAGYLIRLADQKYCLSFKFVRLGGLAQSTLDICQISLPVMKHLASVSGESVTLHTIEGLNRVCLNVVTTPAPLMSLNHPGECAPLSLGAASLVLMAYSTNHSSEKTLASLAKQLRHSQKDLQSIFRNVKKQGYVVSHGGSVPGLSAISVPIFDIQDQARYSLSIVLPTIRARGRIAQLTAILREAGRKISAGFGARAEHGDR